ncbi:MAG: hypothetical protein Q7R50_08015 [Dehalococcoidales bacterium]|nr:hypothetical protein [Dehalococcoidales bacterium]
MKNIALQSALIYTGISLVAAVIFFLATLPGNYTAVERLGGSTWVFILAMIILMPVVIPMVKKRLGR